MRLIDADVLAEVVNHWGESKGREEAADSIIYAINNAPAVEIVRCRECVSYIPENHNFAKHCRLTGIEMDEDGFCFYGERREDNE